MNIREYSPLQIIFEILMFIYNDLVFRLAKQKYHKLCIHIFLLVFKKV